MCTDDPDWVASGSGRGCTNAYDDQFGEGQCAALLASATASCENFLPGGGPVQGHSLVGYCDKECHGGSCGGCAALDACSCEGSHGLVNCPETCNAFCAAVRNFISFHMHGRFCFLDFFFDSRNFGPNQFIFVSTGGIRRPRTAADNHSGPGCRSRTDTSHGQHRRYAVCREQPREASVVSFHSCRGTRLPDQYRACSRRSAKHMAALART